MERLLKCGEVAWRIGLANVTVYAVPRRGLIPHIHVSGSVRFPERELEEWIRLNTHPGRPIGKEIEP